MNFFGKGSAANNRNAKQPTVRRVTKQVPITTSHVPTPSRPTSSSPAPSSAAARSGNPARFNLSASKKQTSTLRHKALATSGRGVKRKSTTPDVMFSDDEGDDTSDVGTSDSDASRKRQKSSVSSVDSSDRPRRCIISHSAFEEVKSFNFIHGAELSSGVYADKYKKPWDQSDFAVVELQYPSRNQRERFELKHPKKQMDEYQPMTDIRDTIVTIINSYFPADLREKYEDVETGFYRRLNLAFTRQSIPEWLAIVEEFNALLSKLIEDGSIQRELKAKATVPEKVLQRVLEQVFERTVSPEAESLNKYKPGSDNVYGELLPRFISEIFTKTGLRHDQMFIDLGSGVGNVVLQAALEIGCDSWGIEMMPKACELADLQAAEFAARTKLWGLDAGNVHLLQGDMTASVEVPKLLQRADVVLVNNQAFTASLDNKLLDMFLDLKEGAQVVSLKPFVPIGHKMAERNIEHVANQLVQKSYEYFSNSVSWSHNGNGHWYIARKDTRPLKEYRKRLGLS